MFVLIKINFVLFSNVELVNLKESRIEINVQEQQQHACYSLFCRLGSFGTTDSLTFIEVYFVRRQGQYLKQIFLKIT